MLCRGSAAFVFYALVASLTSAIGCGGSPGGKSDMKGETGDGGFCTPGATKSCICLGGSVGIQTCRATAQSYGPCIDCGDGGAVVSTDMAISTGNACGFCDGCCNGTSCVLPAAETTAQCGGKGQACMACSGSDTCTNNACVPSGTQSCTGCPNGVICNNGTCTTQIDPNAMFEMVINEVSLAQTDNGSEWSFDCGSPSPFVCVSFSANGTSQTACNTYCNDTYDCMPSGNDAVVGNTSGGSAASAPVYIPGSVIISGGLTITPYNYHYLESDDVAGMQTFPATSTYQATYTTGAFNSVVNVSFSLQ